MNAAPAPRPTKTNAAPTLLLIGATALWGATFVVVDEAIQAYNFLSFLAVRFVLAAGALFPFVLFKPFKMTRRAFCVGLTLGLPIALGYFLQTWGLKYASPTNSGLITGCVVLIAPLLDRALFQKPVLKTTAVFALAALCGLGFMTGASPAEARPGDLLTLGCAFGFALHLTLTSRFAPGLNAVVLTFAQMLACAVLFSAAALLFEGASAPPPSVWPGLLLTGLGASGVCYFILTYAQQRISSARTAMLLTLESAFALLFGLWIGGDRLSLIQWIGAGALLVSIAAHEASALLRGGRPNESAAERPPESA